MTRTSRLLRRLVVVGASTAVIGSGFMTLAETSAFAAAGDNATSVTLAPHGASDTIGSCTPYTATVAPSGGKFDLQLSATAPAGEFLDFGFCSIAGYSTTTYPNQILPATASLQPTQGTNNTTYTGTDSDGNAVHACEDDNSAGTSADPARCDVQIDPGANTKVSFGLFLDHYVNSSPFLTTTATLSEGIVAYDDVNTNNIFEPAVDTQLDSTSETWSAATANTLACAPSSQTADQGGTAHIACTATTAAGTTFTDYFGDRHVRFVVTNGPDKNLTMACTFTPDYTKVTANNGEAGSWDCAVTNGGTAGTDSVTLYADNNDNSVVDSGEPTTTATINFVAPAPALSTVTVTCSPNPTDAAADDCQDPMSDHTATFTATVKNSSGAPVSGVLVSWSDPTANGGSAKSTVSPTTCLSDANGQCSTTLTEPTVTNNEDVTETATVNLAGGGTASDSADKHFHTPTAPEARNIIVTPDGASQQAGASQTFTAKVTDRFGNPIQGVCVGWSLTGGGHFNDVDFSNCNNNSFNGFTTQTFGTTCLTFPNGTCSVTVASDASNVGQTSTVTGSLDPNPGTGGCDTQSYNYGCSQPFFVGNPNECESAAGKSSFVSGDPANPADAPNAPAGNCTDTGSVTWHAPTPPPTKRVIVGLHLTCGSHKPHHVTCIAQLSKPFSGVTVILHRGNGTVVGTAVTDSSGKAKFHLRHLKSGKKYHFYAHAKRSARTFSATSNTVGVRVL